MSASEPTETQSPSEHEGGVERHGYERWSVRTIRHDGTLSFVFPEHEKEAWMIYSQTIRNATSQIKAVELRRHHPDGQLELVAEKEGTWRTH